MCLGCSCCSDICARWNVLFRWFCFGLTLFFVLAKNFFPAVANQIGKTPGACVSDTVEKLGNLAIGCGKLPAKRQQPPPPMKAGGWHGQSDLFIGRSQEILPGRTFTRKVAGWGISTPWCINICDGSVLYSLCGSNKMVCFFSSSVV